MTDRIPAALVLEDGTVFRGWSCGAPGEATGELCFNTSLVGYQEVMTDPSYAGQILTMTYPQIGNYGVNSQDMQSDGMALRGVVVREMCRRPSNHRSEGPLHEMLERFGVVAIEGVDTRRLTKHIRESGAMRAVISTLDLDESSLLDKARASEGIVGVDLVATVSCREVREEHTSAPEPLKVVAYDCGMKRSIVDGLVASGCDVVVVPACTTADEVLAHAPDGVFFSNGPGDPCAVAGVPEAVAGVLGRVPVFGICLGHQMLAIAAGCSVEKLKYGHRGGNQPVKNLLTGRVEITSQNHGFGVEFGSLGPLLIEESAGLELPLDDLRAWAAAEVAPVVMSRAHGRIQLTHVNLNDGTVEGIRFLDIPAFSVQYHPEAAAGPLDASYLFTSFVRLMQGDEGYLSIEPERNLA